MNYIEQAIIKAMGEGYKSYRSSEQKAARDWQITVSHPDFWKSLGKAMGWEGEDAYLTIIMTAHMAYWHRFIDHLAEGKPPEEYFKKLLMGR